MFILSLQLPFSESTFSFCIASALEHLLTAAIASELIVLASMIGINSSNSNTYLIKVA